MRDRSLILGAALGAALLLPVAGSAQTLATPPSWAPSLAQSPTMPPPESSPAAPAAQAKPVEKLKTRAAAPAKKTAKTAKAKPTRMTAPVAQAAAAGEAAATVNPRARHRAGPAHGPRDIVAAIYEVEAGKDGGYGGPSAFADMRIRKLYFSKGLIAAVAGAEKKTAGGSILNFDPITNSETDVEDLAIAPESEKADRMSVAARFNSESDSSIIHYDFVKEGKVWKLDDIRGDLVGQQGEWSLREILKTGAQHS